MSLKSVHPLYADMLPEWEKMRDVYRGERHVKNQGPRYLPPTKGMVLDGYGSAFGTAGGSVINIGTEAYNAYVTRAVLPDYVETAVEVFIGLLHSQDAVIELPARMESMRENITSHGEGLELLLRRINVEQLVTGRLGLLLDLPSNPDPANPLPYVAMYVGESCINWDDGESKEGRTALTFVVLDESGHKRNGFRWEYVSKYRVLEIPEVEGAGGVRTKGSYRQGVFEAPGLGAEPTYVEADMVEPMIRAERLTKLPFVFVNTSDTNAAPDKPPLLGLANGCLTIYRGEADFRQNLHMQGQDTLVVIGDIKRAADPNELAAVDDGPLRIGAGSMIHLEAGDGADAKFAGVSADGLGEQAKALDKDRARAESMSGALGTDNTQGDESGEALKTRVAAKTASLNQIAKTGAGALQYILRIAAEWMGEDPLKVIVTPNLEFADYQITGQNLAQIMAAKASGAPLSRESIHKLMTKGGLTELDYPAEKLLLDQEAAEAPPPGTDAGGNPDDQDEED